MSRLEVDIEVLVEHTMASLPDSLARRKRTLEAALNILTRFAPKHPAIGRLRDCLGAIYSHEVFQRELPALFKR